MPDENQALSPDYLFRLKSFLVDIAIEGRGKLKNLYGQQRVARTQAELNKLLDSHERFAAARGGARAKLGMADLSGLDLANRLLKEIDFAGSSLMDASLFGSDLRNASFYCTDLQRAELRNTTLQFDDLRGASAADFDHRYVTQQVAAHKEANILMRGYAKDGDNASIKSFAADTDKAVKMHLSMAEGLAKKYK